MASIPASCMAANFLFHASGDVFKSVVTHVQFFFFFSAFSPKSTFDLKTRLLTVKAKLPMPSDFRNSLLFMTIPCRKEDYNRCAGVCPQIFVTVTHGSLKLERVFENASLVASR